MNRILLGAIALLVVLMAAEAASAHGRFGFSFGFFAPPVVVGPQAYYPPSYYYPTPPPYAPSYGYREWVPGYWRQYRGPYGWERGWVPGHWRYYR